nr:hypothetical protein [Streptomyces cupreus]
MQVPAQPVDHAGAFGDQVVAVVHQQAHVPARVVEVRGGQVRFPQCRSGCGQSVDGVGLAVGAGGGAAVGHELGRDAHDPFAGGGEVSLETA